MNNSGGLNNMQNILVYNEDATQIETIAAALEVNEADIIAALIAAIQDNNINIEDYT
jgi:hypothetical protein